MDQKNQYDELKEKLLKAGTQKTIIRDQVRGDTEEVLHPRKYGLDLCLWSVQR